MRGIVIEFDEDSGKGLISGNDDKRYHFTKDAWKADIAPLEQQEIDFEPVGENKANDIYLLNSGQRNISMLSFVICGAVVLFIYYWLIYNGFIPNVSETEYGVWGFIVVMLSMGVFSLVLARKLDNVLFKKNTQG